jgi:cobalt/nickel transport system permease protein
LGYALHRVNRTFADRAAPLMGVVAACLFAGQMLNFPVPGGTSGHLLGGVLAAVMLGPWAGVLVLTVVLAVQCVLFQDGGVTTLGANVFNVGVLGSLVGYSIFAPLRRWIGGAAGTVVGSVVAAWFSVVLAAIACSMELAAGSRFVLGPTLGAMLLAHTMIGLGEALITGMAVSFVLRARPDLVYGQNGRAGAPTRVVQTVVGGLTLALVAAVLISPFASSLPDGLEWAIDRLGIGPESSEPAWPAPMPDYAPRGLENLRLAGSIAGAAGTVVVFGVAFLLARGLGTRSSLAHASHAS